MALSFGSNGNLPGDKRMSITTSTCVTVFIALFISSMVMQFIRAKKRQKLVRMVDPERFLTADQQKWSSIENSFDFLFKDFRKLQILKRNSDKQPDVIQMKLGDYRRWSRAEIIVTVSMLTFALFAYRICS